jgi:hypothetical protein
MLRTGTPNAPKVDVPTTLLGVGLVGGGMTGLLVLFPPLRLRDRITAAKPLVGKTRDEVIDALGESREIEKPRKGVAYETWRSLWTSITLEFKNGVCTAIRRQTR